MLGKVACICKQAAVHIYPRRICEFVEIFEKCFGSRARRDETAAESEAGCLQSALTRIVAAMWLFSCDSVMKDASRVRTHQGYQLYK